MFPHPFHSHFGSDVFKIDASYVTVFCRQSIVSTPLIRMKGTGFMEVEKVPDEFDGRINVPSMGSVRRIPRLSYHVVRETEDPDTARDFGVHAG